MLNFMCIGAQKAGTTWLYEQLRADSRIAFPAGKEVHYWDGLRTSQPVAWYLGLFSDPNRINGDITPAYSILEDETVAEISRVCPSTKVVFILRNPIERAWSSALMALSRSEMTLAEASDAWFRDHFQSRGSVLRGDYERTIRIWSRYFPEGTNFRWFFYDDLASSPARFLSEVSEFIGLDGRSDLMDAELAQRVFAGPGAEIRASLAAFLVDLYRTKIDSLGGFIGRDLSGWYGAYS